MAVDNLRPARHAETLLSWYDSHARTLPWRSPPGTPPPEPYRVWLAEIMLQQTTVAAVDRYYRAFTARWPTVGSLAAADDGDVMQAWAGLGYYARARNLLACARTVTSMHGGGFPDTEIALRRLPGIGRYTAAAIAAIAFDRAAVVVDGNVERVVARLSAVETPLPAAKPLLYAHAAALTPPRRPGDYAQAMMDLGATICTPRAPGCPRCPLATSCAARAGGDPARYPVKAAKAARPVRHGTAYWLEAGGKVLLVRRPANGLLGGMLALPSGGWDGAPAAPPAAAEWCALAGTIRHVFTHFEVQLTVAAARLVARPAVAGEWVAPDDLAAAGLPTLFAKAAALAMALPVIPAKAGTHLPMLQEMGPRFRGDDGLG